MAILPQPRALADLVEIDPQLPSGSGESFSGYGVMGLPFTSGHVLALRRFAASSLGYGYTAVWHRTPEGRWTFWSDVAPDLSCARFFGAAVDEVGVCPIRIAWKGSHTLRVTVGEGLVDWRMMLRATPATVAMNAVARLVPDNLWKRPLFLQLAGLATGRLLGLGRVGLTGRSPNGQRFFAHPLQIWTIASSHARVGGTMLEAPAPLPRQVSLGNFAIPQRGIFVIGRSYFDPFDPGRHSSVRGRHFATVVA